MAGQAELPSRETDFSGWYNTVVQRAELADYGPARGTMVIRPYGYKLWEGIASGMDAEIKAAGVENAYFPLFIPMNLLETEAQHIEGFSPQLAVVTHGGGKKLEEPLAVRPTSETIMYPFYKKWVQSWRDLPVLINQWNNVVRWELRTTLFLRTMEFLWQEGHTAHATHEESWAEVLRAMNMYEKVYREFLAIPGYKGVKSESEKFAGADATTTYETLMPDGRALQGCTSHDLGQNFSRPFGITFQNKSGQAENVWQTSWGFTTRSIGALIMVHGDDKGLRLPPRIAPIQAVIVPIDVSNDTLGHKTEQIASALKAQGIRVKIDKRDNKTTGAKYYEWELKGVPVRVEIGAREMESGSVTIYRRDTGERQSIDINDLAGEMPLLLDNIQEGMLQRAENFLHDNTHNISTYDEFKAVIEGSRGMIRAFWCEKPDCEATIKEETKASTRCLPFDAPEEQGACVHCGEQATHRWLFAQSY